MVPDTYHNNSYVLCSQRLEGASSVSQPPNGVYASSIPSSKGKQTLTRFTQHAAVSFQNSQQSGKRSLTVCAVRLMTGTGWFWGEMKKKRNLCHLLSTLFQESENIFVGPVEKCLQERVQLGVVNTHEIKSKCTYYVYTFNIINVTSLIRAENVLEKSYHECRQCFYRFYFNICRTLPH